MWISSRLRGPGNARSRGAAPRPDTRARMEVSAEKLVPECLQRREHSHPDLSDQWTDSVRLEGMATDIKLSRFNNTPWGFRLSGGADFPHPLTVVRVARGSLADDAGLQPGDVLIRINDRPLQDLTHAQAHDWILRAGNNFVFSVVRNHRIATEAQ